MIAASRLLPIVLLLALPTAESAADLPTTGVLTLTSGDSVPGAFRPSQMADAVLWQGTAFTDPFEFVTSAVSSIRFPAAEPPAKPQGEFALELAGGDLLTGRIVDWTKETVTLDSPHFGRMPVRRESVRRMYRLDNNPRLVYSGPSGLADWTADGSGWQEDGPHLWTDLDGAMLTADLNIPDKALIEFELSWTKPPNFVFALAVDPHAKADGRLDGWRFEVWDIPDHGPLRGNPQVELGGGGFLSVPAGTQNEPGRDQRNAEAPQREGTLAIVRERRDIADVHAVQELFNQTRRVHLIACLDQPAGTLEVFRPDGTPVGNIKVPPTEDAKPGRGVRLINRHGDLRLERLRITRWNGLSPSVPDEGRPRFELADGTIVSGEITGFRTESPEFLVRDDDTEQSVKMHDLVAVELPPSVAAEAAPLTALLQDGTRVSGTIDEVRAEALVIASPDIAEPVQIEQQQLRLVVFHKTGEPATVAEPDGRKGRLELGEHKLTGTLVGATEQPHASCLAWYPIGSRTSSPLRPEAAGRIVYRESPTTRIPSEDDPAQQMPARAQPRQNFARLFLRKASEPPQTRPATSAQNLHLVTGDVIPCTVIAIDEQGVRITSSVAAAEMVPHAKIKAVELTNGATLPDLQAAKRDRLLTVPRLQKDSPPTHLLCARTGDFLRCRLIGMRDDMLRVEMQLTEIEIPRERVAQIIWFHPEELDEADEQDPPNSEPRAENPVSSAEQETQSQPEGTEVIASASAQIIQPNGNRVTFHPQAVDGGVISGTSDILGACQFNLDEIDQVVFGRQIEVAAAELPYHQWRLRAAIEPLVAQDFAETGRDAGTVSPLVGQPAPDFELDLLNGERFRLSKQRGRIVVLDFWASWCGPCMQTMPLMEEALREFDAEEVRLVAVNLEEPAGHVKSVLERQQLSVTVALDIDGTTARRYEANAIPQLVIVDREGQVARLYVGGGPNAVEQLKSALVELLAQ